MPYQYTSACLGVCVCLRVSACVCVCMRVYSYKDTLIETSEGIFEKHAVVRSFI